MKIVADSKIPMLKGVLEPLADIEYLPPEEINFDSVKNADALIIRTRTKCNSKLLDGTGVKFIATATIGFDHIDTSYCDSRNIKWKNAPGCNSLSVMQYFASALLTLASRKKLNLSDLTIGIVGVGNVGRKIERLTKSFGMKVLLNDPPRERKEGKEKFVSLENLMVSSDIISFHVPLIKEGLDKTYHLADDSFFAKLRETKIIFNTSRGEVVKSASVKNAIRSNIVSAAVLDVWENEPEIDLELLNLVDIATPHIAGYSTDGKANGTAMCVREVSSFFNLGMDKNWYPSIIPEPENSRIIEVNCSGKTDHEILREIILVSYNIEKDDHNLRESVKTFEKQRNEYPVRREFPYYQIKLDDGNSSIKNTLIELGFNLI
ncbi:MAG: 4-phosphoerythronate dehydrogenase PdxB [Ignavibacteriae bacterium HGW-Ignavibacteriae-3]|nr:MAG: 4-phosphoerythronate dehydrogenase PdxB [Ignavibacteriae bacterium HGW-Ignavibacteriae-3]